MSLGPQLSIAPGDPPLTVSVLFLQCSLHTHVQSAALLLFQAALQHFSCKASRAGSTGAESPGPTAILPHQSSLMSFKNKTRYLIIDGFVGYFLSILFSKVNLKWHYILEN